MMAAWAPLALAAEAPAWADESENDDEDGDNDRDDADDRGDDVPIDTNARPLRPLYGNINPFYGNISPFWGNITPFWGNISPFYGNISPFWGNITPFVGAGNSVAPAWGNIQPFWETVGNKWQATSNAWAAAGENGGGYTAVAAGLREIVALSESTWGAAVSAGTGQPFDAGFAIPLLAKHGIDLDDPATLAELTPQQRADFFLAWYDGLMAYSGRDRADHWMATANWTPALTQQQGSGADTVIGIVDAGFGTADDLKARVIRKTGQEAFVGGHGAAVGSLLVAAHDGEGIMGIAPRARVALHNPFDTEGYATWEAVQRGILELKSKKASIINASLGEPGAVLPETWNTIFGHLSVAQQKHDTVYVIAAGNEGLTQTADIEWGAAMGTHFLLVGSVDPAGTISSFSNRPGKACLLNIGECKEDGGLAEGGLLMNRFITAPGELILVSDGMGGTVRRTGTSLAAPLVSGAIALLHDRWPWLAKDPAASVEIILRSARDVGEIGVDPVYGAGLLDVTASQSPLDWNALQFYKVRGGRMTRQSARQLQSKGVRSAWEANGVSFALFEKVGNSYRDFLVPMSSLLSGRATTAFGSKEEFQHFLTQRLTDFINKNDGGRFTDVASYTTPERGGWRMSIASQDPTAYLTGQAGRVPHSAMRTAAPGGGFALTAGFGAGAMALGGQRGFAMISDFSGDGGVNPLLGLASGGGFFASEFALAERTRVSVGFTERKLAAADDLARSPIDRLFGQAEDRSANALNLRLDHDFAPGAGLSLSYTLLREDNALLAVQAQNGLLEGGSHSEALTLGASAQLGAGLTLAASASAGRTRTSGADQQLVTTGAGVVTSAFAVSATKNGLLGGQDRLRLSFTQPMHVESGRMTLRAAAITDRATGEVGLVESEFAIAGEDRVHTGELLYAAPLQNGRGEISLFGRATFGAAADYRTGFASGVRVRLEM